MTTNLPNDALASDWECYWKNSEPVKQWFRVQLGKIAEDMRFFNHRNGFISLRFCDPNDQLVAESRYYDISTVLALDRLRTPTKDQIKELTRLKKHLVESIRKIDAHIASYVPKGNVKAIERPRYRVKMGRALLATGVNNYA